VTNEYGERQDQARKDDRDDRRATRDPDLLPDEVLDRVQGRVLDPATALTVAGVEPRPTTYVGPALLIADDRFADVFDTLQRAAGELGWVVEEDPNYPPPRVRVDDDGVPVRDQRTESGLVAAADDGFAPALRRVVISVQSRTAQNSPDAWALLQQARAAADDLDALTGVGLDHVIEVHKPRRKKPHWTPNPAPHWTPNPDSPLGSYGFQGSGGRQPVAYAGPRPSRSDKVQGERPVVAILDSGCGEHPWLGFVRRNVTIDGKAIGYVGTADDPEVGGDYVGPLDGGLDPISGHGTFIAGLVHQRCPDADIISWRVVDSDGPVVESFALDTLRQVVELVERHADGRAGGMRIDVLNLSMGYYHETPEDRLEDPTLKRLLRRLGKCGVAVVCSAGNDATARKLYPAAYAPKNGEEPPADLDYVPVTSVGADNPNRTVALFSNTGNWVRCYAPGAAVLSTMPPFEGGLLPMARTTAAGLDRESMDPDDYRAIDELTGEVSGGFALWSGTSFAAPVIAGEIAAELLGGIPSVGGSAADVVKRAGVAVEAVVSKATSWKRAHGDGTASEGSAGE